ncbi:protein turtle homolog A-like isoform X2 [Diorhabda carinulata]|uniref:protein turtle homolog A-like isoform X2 n=1 Tax=Diorhabda carinulata TaxID=1163345 RepID=UPI0025A1E04F|nr:protein turtle homolog A-like isoform X2 [Diorhabda carinulata]
MVFTFLGEKIYCVMLLQVVLVCVSFLGVCGQFENEPVTSSFDVEAVQGGVAKLPCDIEPSIPGDKMHIVIWFKDGENRKTPIYSFDSRDKSLEQGKHWADESVLGGRGYFRYQDKPAKLTLETVKDSDGGIYHCRVDFKQTPTRNIKVNLTIIIPPEKLSVLDETGVHIPDYILGPYNEGSSINITCVATGGRPPPKVTWWQENALLDDSFEYLSERRVRNILHIDRLERKHLHTVFTCQASNNNLVAPISSSVTLDINLRPLWVRLLGDNKPLSAEQTYELSCEVVGSRPEPTITWWKGSTQMKNTRETTSPDRNTTTSVLTFVPTVEDGGKYLSCRGQQPHIHDSGKEDGWKLDIHHVPLVSLELGSTLNGSTIKEGVDVYFECNIKSNPWVYKVSWRHNGKQLYNNIQTNTIVSNQSLVLQSITRARTGLYTCVGHNQEGDGESNPVQLDVKFIPNCRPGQPKVFGVARHEVARIVCELEGNPSDIVFVWKFNNSADMIDIPQSQIQTEKGRSVALYKPMNELDYGTLLCWGKNEIGMQKEPCMFYINPAGKPDALSNCSIVNQTSDSLNVECSEGFDGGLKQEFIMEVFDTATRKLVSNVSSRTPLFAVSGLESGAGFDIGLYAANKKGRSQVSRLQAFTLKAAEKHTASTPVLFQITPLLGALIGVVAALILIAIIIVVVIRLRGGGDRDDKEYDDGGLATTGRRCVAGNSDKASTEPLNKDLNDSVDSLEEKNPDIIPQNNAEDEYQDEERAFERLNNTTMRVYNRMQSPNSQLKNNGSYEGYSAKMMPQVIYNQQCIPMSVIRRQEPTVYAQIDVKRMPTHTLQAMATPRPSSFQTLHHPHLPPYMPRSVRDDGSVSSETPLLNSRDTGALQSLMDINSSRTPTITSTLPRTVTATRF